MVSLFSLLIPIVLSAVVVFIASSIIHMVLGYHRSDVLQVPREDEVMAALKPFNIPPGDYALPRASSMEAMKSPEFLEKMKNGPVVLMTVLPPGPPTLGTSLVLWFIYCLVVGTIAAYVAGSALPRGASYLPVFRFVGCVAFTGYALAVVQTSIWYKRNWATTFKVLFDGLVYGLLTAGVFGWLWPR